MTKLQSDSPMSSEHEDEEEEIPTLVPIVGTKRKLNTDNADTEEAAQDTRRKLLKLTRKIKAPTSQELSQLRETENLFHSNMFRLQIEEILKEIKPKENVVTRMTEWSSAIIEFIKSLKSNDTVHSLADEDCGVELPLAFDIPTDSKTSFQFLAPAGVRVVGSVPRGCGFRAGSLLDVAVEMPKRMVLKGDHLNERYWRKKLAYISTLATKLNQVRKKLNIASVDYTSKGIPQLYHISLQITPEVSISKKAKMNIYVVPEEKSIKQSACYPQASNIRADWMQNLQDAKESQETHAAATPMYNSLLARDVTLLKNEEYVRKCFVQGGDAMRDAYLLLCVWLEQRQLCQGCGSIAHFTLAVYLCRLLESKKLRDSMSSYQMLRNLWVQLSSDGDDWTRPATQVKKEHDPPVTRQTFLDYFPVVFLDASGLYNLTADMTADFYKLLKEEARLAVSCLDDINVDSFRYLFMTPAPFLRQCDNYVRFNSMGDIRSVLLKQDSSDAALDLGRSEMARFANLLVEFLAGSLGERLSSLPYRIYPTQLVIPLNSKSTEQEVQDSSLVIGICLNSETCYKMIHRGPEANLPEAAEFRRLWGSKSELRRFKDGTVCEATVWGSNQEPWSARRLVTRDMILYLLATQWGINKPVYVADQVENTVDNLSASSKPQNKASLTLIDKEEVPVNILQEWDALARCLRDMKSLPLDICSVLSTSVTLRYMDPQPPRPYFTRRSDSGLLSVDAPVPPYVKPVEGVIEVTSSGKWPEDMTAIKALKAAFYIELSDRLSNEHKLISQVNVDFLDVYQAGYVFRLRLLCTPEVTLLKKEVHDGVNCYKNTARSVALQKRLVHLPVLHSALHGLHQAHPVLGPGVCLVKRWLSCQMLLDCRPEAWAPVAVELLGASLVSPAAPYLGPPLSPQTFFLRCLALLSSHNFVTDPVLVNISGELKRNDILHIEARLCNDRGTLPPVTLLTPWDPSAQLWTKEGPNVGTLARTVALSRFSLQLMESRILRGLSVQPIFEFPRDDFDILIGLNKSAVSKLREETSVNQGQRGDFLPVVDFDPVCLYVDLLRESYEDIALFQYDIYGGLEIGVVMKPEHVLNDKDMKLNCKKPAATSREAKLSLVLNREAMLQDLYILGRGLVKSVTCKQTGLVESPFRAVAPSS